MGREIKRVPLDFTWTLHQPWKGYLPPDYDSCSQCPACEGSGYSPEANLFKKEWHGSIYPEVDFDPASTGSTPFEAGHPVILTLARRNVADRNFYAQRLNSECYRLARHFNSSWNHHLSQDDVDALVAENRLSREGLTSPITAAAVNVWSLSGLGHDSISAWICIKARCERLGVSPTCPACNGSGEIWTSEEDKLASESWERTDPPEGPGWQLWETVSGGSPISPVFASPEELAQWLSENSDENLSPEKWLAWITKSGWAPSGPLDSTLELSLLLTS